MSKMKIKLSIRMGTKGFYFSHFHHAMVVDVRQDGMSISEIADALGLFSS